MRIIASLGLRELSLHHRNRSAIHPSALRWKTPLRCRLTALCPALLALWLLLGACAVVSKPEPERAVSEIEGDRVEALEKQAARPYSLKARANLRLRLRGKDHPRIKGIVSWARTPEGMNARITGVTAFGITVFDCMVADRAFYLFDPSQDTVYMAGLREEVLDGWELEALAQEAFWILAPWATCQSQDARVSLYQSGPTARLSVAFSHEGTEGEATFDACTLAPVSLRLPEFTVIYGDPIALPDGSPYPRKLEVRFTYYPLNLEIALKDLETGSLSAADTLFRASVFAGKPALPLEVLFNRLRTAR